MKKMKKYYPLFVGLVLLLSVAIYGTRAFFSDSTKEQAGIKLTLGTVDIQSDSTKWTYNNNGSYDHQLKGENNVPIDTTSLSKKENITNVKPGDSFSREFTFTNKSTLISMVNLVPTIPKEIDANSPYVVSWEVLEYKEGQSANVEHPYDSITDSEGTIWYKLYGGEEAKVKLTVSVKENITNGDINDFNSAITSNKATLDLLDNYIEVKIRQAQ